MLKGPLLSPLLKENPVTIHVLGVCSALAKDALRVPRRLRTALFTSSRDVASTTQAAKTGGSALPMTTMVFAESSRAYP